MKKIPLLCLALTGFLEMTTAAEKPNILFVFIDDMGYGDLACFGSKVNESPNIDRLANEGIRFSQFYVNAPICSPSRVAITTGQYPARWEITSYINDHQSNKKRGMKDFLDSSAPSLARNLKEAGYYTAHIGKWHMGGSRDVGDVPYITEYGFDESVTQFEGIGERYLATYETLNLKDGIRNLEKMSADLGKGEVHWIKREDCTKAFVDRAIQAIGHARDANKPFYINLWPDDVHTPLEPPKHLRGDGSTEAHYKGVIKVLDEQLERIFDYIKQDPSLKNNTLIVLTSDNGPAKNVGSALNLKGFKGNLYEGGIREPLIVWGPKLVAPEQVGKINSKTVIAGIDLAPSLIEIAGAKKTRGVKYDGVDMSQSLLGHQQAQRKKAIIWQRPSGIVNMNKTTDNPDLAIRQGDYKLLVNVDGSNAELYHIGKDEEESNDLSGENQKVTRKLKKKVLNWYSTMPQIIHEGN